MFVRCGILVPLLFLATACQEGRQNYLTSGIGTELSGTNLAAAETLQNRYFGYLCRQASAIAVPDTTCLVSDWNLIAAQGMNDIDRRCDAYLQWLDNRKRSKGPWVSQIGDTAAATNSILSLVSPGSKAITIVAQAFQLVTKSVENYHSRLLLEVESSTVNSIVLQSRQNFRQYLIDNHRKATNKPEAEYILRAYTRLCLPFAIEAKVNDYSTLGSLGVAVSAQSRVDQEPVLNKSSDQLPQVSIQQFNNSGLNRFEKALGSSEISQIQAALCVEVDGVWGAATRAALVEFYNGAGEPRPSIAQTGIRSDDLVKLRVAMQQSPTCNAPSAHKSAFQLGQFVS
ncbi:hypothetical protein DFR52_104501 [Hoeflea marina]|uniref:Uncharacterized protein n=2 Tax=Hoeflea marina TaxID=274592 RepID=A0A317PIF7_9HYPH|nr:hypothetical protein DFR52_104501 [Hoeflea marina]